MNTTRHTSQAAQPWTRFQDCINAYGAQRLAWPEEERALYDQFAVTVAGQQALQPARELDLLLSVDGEPTVAPDFLARLQAMPLPPQHQSQNVVVMFWRRNAVLKRGAFVLLIMAALGFSNGYAENAAMSRVWNSGTMTTAFGVAATP